MRGVGYRRNVVPPVAVTSGSARRPCWLPPCGASLRASWPRHRDSPKLPAARAASLRGMMFSPRLRATSMTQRIASAVRRDDVLHRHLVGGATDAARLHFDGRRNVGQRLLDQRQACRNSSPRSRPWRRRRFLGDRLLAALHDHVDETGHDFGSVLGSGRIGAGTGVEPLRDMLQSCYWV